MSPPLAPRPLPAYPLRRAAQREPARLDQAVAGERCGGVRLGECEAVPGALSDVVVHCGSGSFVGLLTPDPLGWFVLALTHPIPAARPETTAYCVRRVLALLEVRSGRIAFLTGERSECVLALVVIPVEFVDLVVQVGVEGLDAGFFRRFLLREGI